MFDGYIVVITGAASGIGLATARQFVNQGAIVLGADVDRSGLETAQKDLGSSLVPIICDVTKEDEVAALAGYVNDTHGKLDVLVNNAGAGYRAALKNMQESDFDFHYSVNVKGPMFMVKHCLPLLRRSSHPAIVNVSSNVARATQAQNHFLYSTAKAALLKFNQHLVRDLPGIRSNTVLPGWVDTPMTKRADLDKTINKAIHDKAVAKIPAGRFGTPDEIANTILFLASEKASYINGASVDIDGGLQCNADWGFL